MIQDETFYQNCVSKLTSLFVKFHLSSMRDVFSFQFGSGTVIFAQQNRVDKVHTSCVCTVGLLVELHYLLSFENRVFARIFAFLKR